MVGPNTLAVFYDIPTKFESGEYDWLYVAIVATAGSYVCYIFSKYLEACFLIYNIFGF